MQTRHIGKPVIFFLFLIGLFFGIFISKYKADNVDIFSKNAITAKIERVYNWQMRNFNESERYSRRWQFATLRIGIMAAYRVTNNPKYLKEALEWSEENRWETGFDTRDKANLRHIDPPADNQCCAQTYLELYLIKKDPRMLTSAQSAFDKLLSDSPKGREEWWWVDALFMAPPVLARLGMATNEAKYYNLLHEMWWDTASLLFDEDANLFYRDNESFKERSENGRKVFWARGNGWAMAGIARVVDYLPEEDSKRTEYIKLFKRMAKAVIEVQGEDGLWRTSLLDSSEFPEPETSSSSLFCFALAWGINHGILDRAVFLPAVEKAWKGLYLAVDKNGKLCCVQKPNRKPGPVSKDDTAEHGVGAFLMAASEMIKLNIK